MPWQAVMLLQNVFASVYALQSRSLAKKYQKAHFQVLAAAFGIMYLVFLGYAMLHIRDIRFDVGLSYLPLTLGVAACFTVWTVLTFVTLRYVDASTGTLLTVLNLVSIVVVATLVIGEGLSLLQFAGSILLLLAIYVVFSTHTSAKVHRLYWLAALLSLASSLFYGFAISGEKYILNHVGTATYAVFGIGAQFLLLLALAIIYNRRQFSLFNKWVFTRQVVSMGVVRGGSGLLFIVSLVSANNASLVGMLTGLKIIITTVLGAILLKEVTFIKRKVLASCIACVGVGMLMW